ncbi:glutathione S-transferase [Rhodoplanes elegans]|uniref:Glutathione S-transferase n=1 Tax=Rhodoplanes elegans TaxID=29408 RepID=A0A327KLB4_9BRAD|nr:glutathione S-transferase C-terminal domain-containing protein [Rhodoplanes elegans]MBK5960668.1 glutathione S-transferase [Rhodoplanes elegans]RAI39650.1 glutathione S-transferase [Rhodoplanes elegans]
MITLYGFGPAFGLPDPSPFVTKAETLLKMAAVPYRSVAGNLRKAPKGKLPYIDDDGAVIADSTLIRWHLEKKYGLALDKDLTDAQRAVAWAFEKMIEEHLYWAFVHARWIDDANFDRGPRQFFGAVPAPMRGLVIAMVRRGVRRDLHAQGLARHSPEDMLRLGTRSIDAVADHLGDKPFFMGDQPTVVDATVFPFMAGALCRQFITPLRTAAERHANLPAYVARMAASYFPDYPELTGGATS